MIFDMKTIAAAVIIASFCVLAGETNTKVEAHELVSQAAEIFSQANQESGQAADILYIEAAKLYEKAAEKGGISNAKLYYNIGNSYLLAGDLGMAIYNYKRGIRLDPSDPLLQRNLSVARGKRLDKVDTRIETKVLAKLCFWHYDFSLRARFYAAAILFAVLMVLFTLRVWVPSLPGFVPAAVVCGVLFVSMAASVAVEAVYNRTHHQGVIIAGEVVARKGDSERYEPSFKEPLHSGTEFELLEKRPQWIKVKLTDGSQVWLPEDACILL